MSERNYYSFGQALEMMKQGYKMARYGFTKHNLKWIEYDPGSETVFSHFILVYPPCERYPQGKKSPGWKPSGRCDMLDDDWYVVEAPEPTETRLWT